MITKPFVPSSCMFQVSELYQRSTVRAVLFWSCVYHVVTRHIQDHPHDVQPSFQVPGTRIAYHSTPECHSTLADQVTSPRLEELLSPHVMGVRGQGGQR